MLTLTIQFSNDGNDSDDAVQDDDDDDDDGSDDNNHLLNATQSVSADCVRDSTSSSQLHSF